MVLPNFSGGSYKRMVPGAIAIKQVDIPIDTAHLDVIETEHYEGFEYQHPAVVANDYLIGRLAPQITYVVVLSIRSGGSANTLVIIFEYCYLDNYAETCFLNETKLEFNNYNDSINLELKTDCSHNEFNYYSFKEEEQQMLEEFESAADLGISYTNHSTNHDNNTNICVYHINIQMTEEMHEHLQGVIFISTLKDTCSCYPKPLRYNITAPQIQPEYPTPLRYNITTQPKCNCNQETTGQTKATATAYLDLTTSSSCKVIAERMLPPFCSLICLIFVIALNNQ